MSCTARGGGRTGVADHERGRLEHAVGFVAGLLLELADRGGLGRFVAVDEARGEFYPARTGSVAVRDSAGSVPMTNLFTGGRNCSIIIVEGLNPGALDWSNARIATASSS